jgi:hypothetical protein
MVLAHAKYPCTVEGQDDQFVTVRHAETGQVAKLYRHPKFDATFENVVEAADGSVMVEPYAWEHARWSDAQGAASTTAHKLVVTECFLPEVPQNFAVGEAGVTAIERGEYDHIFVHFEDGHQLEIFPKNGVILRLQPQAQE